MRGAPRPFRRTLLRFALESDDDTARAEWHSIAAELTTVLERRRITDGDLLPLVAHRLAELHVDGPLVPLLTGMLRRTWYANQLVLRDLVTELPAVPAGAVVAGRAASLLAYLPATGALAVDRGELRSHWDGPTIATALHGAPVRVPAPADHLVEMLLRRWWADAAWTARHQDMDWNRFVAVAGRRHLRLTMRRRLAVLRDLAGDEIVRASVIDQLRQDPFASARERIGGSVVMVARALGIRRHDGSITVPSKNAGPHNDRALP